ncbi:MAG: hypothetical protein OXE95_01965, partial [Chloroflexi bacterium]|nr:hypothetical protein [Chloroflexota bacterium]
MSIKSTPPPLNVSLTFIVALATIIVALGFFGATADAQDCSDLQKAVEDAQKAHDDAKDAGQTFAERKPLRDALGDAELALDDCQRSNPPSTTTPQPTVTSTPSPTSEPVMPQNPDPADETAGACSEERSVRDQARESLTLAIEDNEDAPGTHDENTIKGLSNAWQAADLRLYACQGPSTQGQSTSSAQSVGSTSTGSRSGG